MGLMDCRLLDLQEFRDERGNLTVVEGNRHIPFDIQRVYYLYDVSDGAVRGVHAHRELQQIIIPLSGSFDVILDDGQERKRFHLSRPNQGLYVCPMVWREIHNFSDHSVCMVLASRHYEPSDYIHEYDEFLSAVRGKR